MRIAAYGARCGGKFNKENKPLEMFQSSMASPKKCHVCCCKSSSRWYSIVKNVVEDVRNCFNVETSCNASCLCAFVGEILRDGNEFVTKKKKNIS